LRGADYSRRQKKDPEALGKRKRSNLSRGTKKWCLPPHKKHQYEKFHRATSKEKQDLGGTEKTFPKKKKKANQKDILGGPSKTKKRKKKTGGIRTDRKKHCYRTKKAQDLRGAKGLGRKSGLVFTGGGYHVAKG